MSDDPADPVDGGPPAHSSRTLWAILVLLAGVVIVVSWARCRYGVDLSDEATYAALAHRFHLGDTPFVDEHSPAQTAALLTWPVVALLERLNGSAESLILHLRIVYWFLALTLGGTIAWTLRPRLGLPTAGLVGLLPLTFCPVGLPTLSYNTISCGAFTAGIFFIGMHSIVWNRSRGWIYCAGLAHGIAAVALPSYAIPNLAYFAILWFGRHRSSARRDALLYAAGGTTVLLFLLPWLMRMDTETLQGAYAHARRADSWGARVLGLGIQFWTILMPKPLFLGALASVLILAHTRLRWFAGLILIALPLVPLAVPRDTSPVWYSMMLSIPSCCVLWLGRREAFCRQLMVLIAVPALMAGSITSVTSASGTVNAGLGLFPLCLVGVACVPLVLPSLVPGLGSRVGGLLSSAYPALTALAFLGYQQFVYTEGPASKLTAIVDSGPYRGLHTSPLRAAFLRDLAGDFARTSNDDSFVAFVPHLPAGYLLTDCRPAMSSVWIMACTEGPAEDCLHQISKDLSSHLNSKLLVCRVRQLPAARDGVWVFDNAALDQVLESMFVPVLSTSAYSLLRPRDR